MAFLDDISDIISEKGKEAAQIAKKVAEIANLKGQISGMETEIRKKYRKLGEAYFEAYKVAEVSCEFEEYVQTIRDAKATVAELNRKLAELKGDMECKGCGSVVKAGSAFCSTCGTKVEVEYFDEEDEDEFTQETTFEEVVDVDTDEVEELVDIEE